MGGKSSKEVYAYELPDLTGKTYVVTGANTGLGLASSKDLAKKGAFVIMACRSKERGEAALQEVQKHGKAELRLLDLADLDSVKEFVEGLKQSYKSIDGVLNNAGIMACPQGTTKQGLELQHGTNHFGHFALNLQMLPLLRAAPEARIAVVASMAAEKGIAPKKINWDDFQYQKKGRYSSFEVYGQSKLSNLLYALELQKKLDAAGVTNVTVASSHPGWTTTDLQRHSGLVRFLQNTFVSTMKPHDGCKSQVLSLVKKDLPKNSYTGPAGRQTGEPAPYPFPPLALDETYQTKLWELSEKLTGVTFSA